MSKTPESIFDFPQEIIFNILSRLPVKSLLQFRCVCTSAPPLISHPYFTKLHLTSTVADHRRTIVSSYLVGQKRNYSLRSPLTFHETLKFQFPDVPVKLRACMRYVGSNKGLICLYYTNVFSSSGTLILWNPSINKYKILDGPHNLQGQSEDQFSMIVFGFGFVSRTCEFKVVGIVYDYAVHRNRNKIGLLLVSKSPVVDKNNIVLVYSLSTNSWEKKEGLIAPCYFLASFLPSAIFVNAYVNWLAYKEDESRVIMAFNLDNERFLVIDLPKDIAPNYHDPSLNSFGEDLSLSLSLCARYREVNVDKWDVWVMGEYGVVDSWKKLFVISESGLPHPPLFMKSDREILISTNVGRLVLFDATKNEMQDLGTQGEPTFFHALSYTASLALLDGISGEACQNSPGGWNSRERGSLTFKSIKFLYKIYKFLYELYKIGAVPA